MVNPKHHSSKSEWIAVAPEFTNRSNGDQTNDPKEEDDLPKVTQARSAYLIFNQQNVHKIKQQLIARNENTDLSHTSKAVSQAWKDLDAETKAFYEDLANQEMLRFRQESHLRDVAVMERREKLRREREEIIIPSQDGRRSTRGLVRREQKRAKKKAKKERNGQDRSKANSSLGGKGAKSNQRAQRVKEIDESDEADFESEDSKVSSHNGSWRSAASGSHDEVSDSRGSDSFSDDSDDSNHKKIAAKKRKPTYEVSAAVAARREKARLDKEEKESYISHRQGELRNERATQAKKRLDFLIQQSDIFRHFGNVKEDRGKFFSSRPGALSNTGTTSSNVLEASGSSSHVRRSSSLNADIEADELEQVDEHSATFLTSQPSTLGFGKMRAYQLEGLNWMIRLQENGVNGILADEMGLGKTLQSISVLVYMMEFQDVNGPHLIVVPKSTLSNWMSELERWAPKLKSVKFHGTKEQREEIANNILQPGQRDYKRTWHVCVTTYEVCNLEKNVLNKFAWCYLIIDEAHRLKNEASAFSRTIRTFETRYRLLLTGTPLQNNLHELWALLNFLVPDVFASSEQFDEWFNLDIEDVDEKNNLISQLHKILRPFMLRRLKVDVETSLPPKHETILFIGLSAMQKKLYKDILMRDLDVLQGGSAGSRTAILNIVMQLRKCAGHPYLFPGVEDRSLPPLGEHLVENCGKMVLLDKLLKRLQELGHRVLLFTQMTRVLDILEDYMVMRKFKYCRIDGDTDYEKREESIDSFNAPGSDKFLFLLSTRAGGLGINLQTADVVILYDSDWNPQVDLQAQDRAHRIGQKKKVQVFRLVTESTIEEKIIERAQQKLKLDAMVVQQGRLKEKDKLSRDDLLDAIRFGADKVFKSKDSSITDDDIDLIIEAGMKKTQELNDKLKAADKGDLLDFKLDGGFSSQTFEGVDYSKQDFAQARAAQAQAELFSILDMGKRERRTVANYNEDLLYRQQVGTQQGDRKKKKETIKLPDFLRLPRMDEWQMFDRKALYAIQEEEEVAFRALPEDVQKAAKRKSSTAVEETVQEMNENDSQSRSVARDDVHLETKQMTIELPPLLSEEKQREKERLLSEGFVDWDKSHFLAFIKASGLFGRNNFSKIALTVGKPQKAVEEYAAAFWDANIGKKRISENEYDRQVKSVEKGEKKLEEIKSLERSTSVFLSLFENPWRTLEFTFAPCKDKLFTLEEDRYLLCWARKYGYGQWEAVKFAVRRSPEFRFDYYLRSLPAKVIGMRCEQLMKAAEKEVELMEKKFSQGSVVQTENKSKEGLEPSASFVEDDTVYPCTISSSHLPSFMEIQAMKRKQAADERVAEQRQLENKVEEIESQITAIQHRMKYLQTSLSDIDSRSRKKNGSSLEFPESMLPDLANLIATSSHVGLMAIANEFCSKFTVSIGKKLVCAKIEEIATKEKPADDGDRKAVWHLHPEYMNLLTNDTIKRLRKSKDDRAESKHSKHEQMLDEINHTDSLDGGAPGPDGTFVPFPDYDGSEEPRECKKAFTLFCNGTRREVKATLDAESRKDKDKINTILKNMWTQLTDGEKAEWRKWEEWDSKRYERDLQMFENGKRGRKRKLGDIKIPTSGNVKTELYEQETKVQTTTVVEEQIDLNKSQTLSIPKKKRPVDGFQETNTANCIVTDPRKPTFHVPKKKKDMM